MNTLIVIGKLMQLGALIVVFSIVKGAPLPLGPASSTIIDCDGVNCVQHGHQRAAFFPKDSRISDAELRAVGEHPNDIDTPKWPAHLGASRFRRAPEEDFDMEEEDLVDPDYYEGRGAEGVRGKKTIIAVTIFVVWVCWICIVLSVLRLVAKNLA